jgi:teichuronic acid exporter
MSSHLVAEKSSIEASGASSTHLLDRVLIHGIAWTGAIKWGSQLLSWMSTIVVARILNPEDYGLVAMAGVFLGFIGVLNEFGLGAAVVALRHLTTEQIGKIHTLAGCFGIVAFAATCGIAVPAGHFFRSPDLPLVIAVASTGFIFTGLRSVPGAWFEKELRFKFLALIEGGQAVLTTVTTVVIAWLGGGYWALVLGVLAGTAGAASALIVACPVRYAWPLGGSLREALRFSSHILVNRLSWNIASSADVFIGGRMLGQTVIGVYSFGGAIASVPMEKVTALMSRVMPAFYSSLQADPPAMRRYLLLVTEGVSLITFPVGIGMMLVADDFVRVVFGVKWEQAIAPLQVLAAWAAVRSIIGLIPPIAYVTGGSRIMMFNGLLCAGLFPVGFFIGSHWGAVGLAWAWVVVQPIAFVELYRHVLKATELSFARYGQALKPALNGVSLMALGVVGLRFVVSSEWPPAFRLTAECLSGAAIYGAAMVILHRDRLRQVFSLIRNNGQ